MAEQTGAGEKINVMSGIGLRTKTLLGIMVIFALLGLGLVLIAKPALQQKLFVTLQKRGISIANGIAADSINPILTEQYFELKTMLKDSMASEDDIVYILYWTIGARHLHIHSKTASPVNWVM